MDRRRHAPDLPDYGFGSGGGVLDDEDDGGSVDGDVEDDEVDDGGSV